MQIIHLVLENNGQSLFAGYVQSLKRLSANDVYPVLSNGGRSERVLLVHRRTFALYSQTHSTTALDRFPPVPTLCTSAGSYTFPVRRFRYSLMYVKSIQMLF